MPCTPYRSTACLLPLLAVMWSCGGSAAGWTWAPLTPQPPAPTLAGCLAALQRLLATALLWWALEQWWRWRCEAEAAPASQHGMALMPVRLWGVLAEGAPVCCSCLPTKRADWAAGWPKQPDRARNQHWSLCLCWGGGCPRAFLAHPCTPLVARLWGCCSPSLG